MLPRWFRIVIGAEVAGLVLLVVLLVHLAGSGVQAVGQVVEWARPHLAQSSPAPAVPVAPAVPRAAPPPAAGVGGLAQLGGPLLHQLDKDTEATANGEMRLLAQMEAVLRARVEAAVGATLKGR
ncbi:MAG TPA: hypothetical protein VI316_07485 [Candidatus Dormibacteraeota bacterium]